MKKLYLLVIPVLIGSFILLKPQSKVDAPMVIQASEVPQVEAKHQEVVTEVPTVVEEVQTVENIAPVEVIEEAPVVYGADASHEGLNKVFLPQDAVTQAGIASSDFQYVDFIVKRNSITRDWWYNDVILLFNVSSEQMSAFGADYASNPITQLRWADAYVKSTHGSWAVAFESVKNTNKF